MAKRFHDSNKWDDPWYLELSNEHKLAWDYITSKCDAVGVWKPSVRLLEFNVGLGDISAFLEICGDRIRIMENGNWWIVKFCDFQYGTLSEESCWGEKDGKRYVKNKPHLSYINLLKKHRLWIDYTKGIHTLKEKDKDKEKEKDKDKDKGGVGEKNSDLLFPGLTFPFQSEEFLQTWCEWVNYRKEILKPYQTQSSMQYALQELGKHPEATAIAMIKNTMASSWKNIRPLDNDQKTTTNGKANTNKQFTAGGFGSL